MQWFEYVIWAAAIFFAGSWTLGLVLSPRNRTGGNILTVVLWWIAMVATFIGEFSSMHLLWAFPAALLVPLLLLGARAAR